MLFGVISSKQVWRLHEKGLHISRHRFLSLPGHSLNKSHDAPFYQQILEDVQSGDAWLNFKPAQHASKLLGLLSFEDSSVKAAMKRARAHVAEPWPHNFAHSLLLAAQDSKSICSAPSLKLGSFKGRNESRDFWRTTSRDVPLEPSLHLALSVSFTSV